MAADNHRMLTSQVLANNFVSIYFIDSSQKSLRYVFYLCFMDDKNKILGQGNGYEFRPSGSLWGGNHRKYIHSNHLTHGAM